MLNRLGLREDFRGSDIYTKPEGPGASLPWVESFHNSRAISQPRAPRSHRCHGKLAPSLQQWKMRQYGFSKNIPWAPGVWELRDKEAETNFLVSQKHSRDLTAGHKPGELWPQSSGTLHLLRRQFMAMLTDITSQVDFYSTNTLHQKAGHGGS